MFLGDSVERGTSQLVWSLFITFWSICKLPSYKLRQQTLWKCIYVSFSKLLATTVQPQFTVQGPEMFPHPKRILEWEPGNLLMETRCEDVREPFPFVPSDQPYSSRDIQATDTMAGASTDSEQKECGLQVSATSITLSRGPIPADIAQGLARLTQSCPLRTLLHSGLPPATPVQASVLEVDRFMIFLHRYRLLVDQKKQIQVNRPIFKKYIYL